MPCKTTGLPLQGHVGSFGHKRKYDIHTGVDLYVPIETPVYAMEEGEVIKVAPFTGPHAGLPWWNNTDAVYIKSTNIVILYGEIQSTVKIGDYIEPGQLIGHVIEVLKTNKGRPTSMLHLEMHTQDSTAWYLWEELNNKPEKLLDPTPYLLQTLN